MAQSPAPASASTQPRWPRRLGSTALWLVVITVLALAAALVVARTGPGAVQSALLIYVVSVLGAVLCIAIGLIAFFLNRRHGNGQLAAYAAVAALVGLALTANNYLWFSKASGVPSIHDVTTDVEDPPLFIAIAPLRADAPNPVDYLGGDVTEKQLEGYPDIKTIETQASAATVFAAAESVARRLGWEIVSSEPEAGRIEATDTTRFFAFKDDVSIRIRPTPGGSIVDVRSKSRVGMGDMGANADRIRAFRDQLLDSI